MGGSGSLSGEAQPNRK